MNREIKSKKVKGKGRVFTSICPVMEKPHSTIMVGSPICTHRCPHFVKIINHRNGTKSVHCNEVSRDGK